MSDEPNGKDRWISPGVLFGAIGMLGAVGGAWMSFESRISRIEQTSSLETGRLDRIEGKLDRLIERGK